MSWLDPNYIIFVMLPSLVISGITQMFIRNAYSKWAKEGNGRGVTGVDTANAIMQNYQLRVRLEGVSEPLGEHFSPAEGVVRLSQDIASQPSIASMAIVAHEFGHVQQYAQKSGLIGARGIILNIASRGGSASTLLIIAGVIMQFAPLGYLGLILFASTTLFAFLTVPVEIDASRRGMKMLREMNFFANDHDRHGAQQVLIAAALTYVGALTISLLNLAYYAALVSNINRRDD